MKGLANLLPIFKLFFNQVVGILYIFSLQSLVS